MFRVKPHESKPLRWWYEQRDKIAMAPSYQREGNIWGKTKKANLIDSILNDYDIPKFYLADFNYLSDTPLNEKKKPYAVIDGKQRLETIFQFFEGKSVRLLKDFVYEADPSLHLGGMTYADLRSKYPKIADKFDKHIPAIMSVVSDDEDKVDALFVRLNSGLEINGAERRNAMPGIIPKLIRKLVHHSFFTTKINFNVKRMAQYNVAAKILLIQYRGKFVDTKASNLDRFVKEGDIKNTSPFKEAFTKVRETLDVMDTVFLPKDLILSSNGSIPLYYWFILHHPSENIRARPFLEQFAKKLRENFELFQETPNKADAELSSYYTMGRTTNDQASLEGRYKILEKHFAQYARTAGRR